MSEQLSSTRDLVTAYNNVSGTSGTDLNSTWSLPAVQTSLKAAIDALERLRLKVLIAKAEQENEASVRNIKRNEEFIENLRREAK